MVNRQRMIEEFIELVKIDNLSKNERQMADTLTKKLKSMNFVVEEDDTGVKIGGNTGNLICTIQGNKKAPCLLLMAHMDSVAPGEGKNPIIEGNVIKTDGKTVLGGDDLAGVTCILETLRVLKEEGIEHGAIQIVFSVAEEIGLMGAKHLDYSKIKAKYGFVMDDGGPIGHVAVEAPSQYVMHIVITGKAAHAGLEPEKGVSAILIASKAISSMRLGRIDDETTANIGIIQGGRATNIVCDRVEIKAEARSRDERKLEQQGAHMRACFEHAVNELGGSMEYHQVKEYPAFHICKEDEIVNILQKASHKAGVLLCLEATGGGSDTNILNGKGIKAVDISVGMSKVHSVEEEINIEDMVNATRFLIEIVQSASWDEDVF